MPTRLTGCEAFCSTVKISLSFLFTYFTAVKSVNPRDKTLIRSEASVELWLTRFEGGNVLRMELALDRFLTHSAERVSLYLTASPPRCNEEQSVVTVTNQSQLCKQTFSWPLISLPHLLLLCLSSTSSVPFFSSLLQYPNLSLIPLPVLSRVCQSLTHSFVDHSAPQRGLTTSVCC